MVLQDGVPGAERGLWVTKFSTFFARRSRPPAWRGGVHAAKLGSQLSTAVGSVDAVEIFRRLMGMQGLATGFVIDGSVWGPRPRGGRNRRGFPGEALCLPMSGDIDRWALVSSIWCPRAEVLLLVVAEQESGRKSAVIGTDGYRISQSGLSKIALRDAGYVGGCRDKRARRGSLACVVGPRIYRSARGKTLRADVQFAVPREFRIRMVVLEGMGARPSSCSPWVSVIEQ